MPKKQKKNPKEQKTKQDVSKIMTPCHFLLIVIAIEILKTQKRAECF